MTTDSFTGEVKAEEWTLVSTLTGITFTVGNRYNITVNRECQFKVADYIQPVRDPIKNTVTFDYIASSDDLYIKTGSNPITLSILDCGAASSS